MRSTYSPPNTPLNKLSEVRLIEGVFHVNVKVRFGSSQTLQLNVALMLCSMYATSMSRNAEVPVFNQIEEVRTARGLSRQELADLVGVHYQTIGYLERGEYSPSLVLALRISEALNEAVSDLFSLTDPSKGKK